MVVKAFIVHLCLLALWVQHSHGSAPKHPVKWPGIERTTNDYDTLRINWVMETLPTDVPFYNSLRDSMLPRVQRTMTKYMTVERVTSILSLANLSSCAKFFPTYQHRRLYYSNADVVVLITLADGA
jgi:hypothetical protein